MDASLQKRDLIPLNKGEGAVGAHFHLAIVGKGYDSRPFFSPDFYASEDRKIRGFYLPPSIGFHLDAYVPLGYHLSDREAFLVYPC